MKQRALRGALVVLGLALTACASPHAAFIQVAVDHDTQASVAGRWGPPLEKWELLDGETLWRYRAPERLWAYQDRSGKGGSPGGITVAGPGLVVLSGTRCAEYLLRFDRAQVLRAWNRQPCQAGTAMAPLR